MTLWSIPQPAVRNAWANLCGLSSATSALARNIPLSSSRMRCQSTSPSLTAAHILLRSLHTSTRLARQRRWRDDDERRLNRDPAATDDYYINYKQNIEPLPHTDTDSTDNNANISTQQPPLPATAVHLDVPYAVTTPAVRVQAVQPAAAVEEEAPRQSNAEYRQALFAAREARRAQQALQESAHTSGPSRRVRRWMSNQKRLRSRAERRRQKSAIQSAHQRDEKRETDVQREEEWR